MKPRDRDEVLLRQIEAAALSNRNGTRLYDLAHAIDLAGLTDYMGNLPIREQWRLLSSAMRRLRKLGLFVPRK
jgi:hypothetical protein